MTKVARPRPGEPIRLVYTSGGAPRYRVVLDVSEKGEPRKQVTTTHASIKAAREYVIETRAAVSRGAFLARSVLTFKALSDDYLRRVERGDHGRKPVRASTLAGYKAAMARVCDQIGDKPVTALRYKDIARMVDAMAESHSQKSVALALTLTRSTLAFAVRERIVPVNVADGVSAKGEPAQEREAYTPDQIRALSAAAEGHRLGGVFATVLLGLRRGEALGLRWEDVDFAAGVLNVRRSRVWISGGFVDNDPKTSRGRREVRLDAVSVDRLKAMRAVHAAERLAVGIGLTGEDVLAANEDGTPLRPEHLTTEWRRLCARASQFEEEAGRDAVPYLGLHAARHGAVKLLRAAGISDGVIARRMGHDENVMRVVYGAPRTVEQDPAAAVMDRLLG